MALTDRLLFLNIFVLGVVVAFTDLKQRRIYNIHLLLSFCFGVGILLLAGFRNELLKVHFISAAVAGLVGILCYRFDVWRGGDAKLFALMAFLMPATGNDNRLFTPAISLFASTFLFGTLVLVPTVLGDMVHNRKVIFQTLTTRNEVLQMWNTFISTMVFSWLIFPVYFLVRQLFYPKVVFIITFILMLIDKTTKTDDRDLAKRSFLVLVVFVVGFLSRLILAPGALSWAAMQGYLGRVFILGFAFWCVNISIERMAHYKDRFPFAVMLVAGCMVAYTPFLKWVLSRF